MTIEDLYAWSLRHNVETYKLIIKNVSNEDLRLCVNVDHEKKEVEVR